jgi:hypothetical protein
VNNEAQGSRTTLASGNDVGLSKEAGGKTIDETECERIEDCHSNEGGDESLAPCDGPLHAAIVQFTIGQRGHIDRGYSFTLPRENLTLLNRTGITELLIGSQTGIGGLAPVQVVLKNGGRNVPEKLL